MPGFDPFTATLDEAEAQPDAEDSRGAVFRWIGASELTGRRSFYEADPMAGIALCATYELVAPEWLAKAFLRCYDKVTSYQVRTWDEAFGPALPKGMNLAAARRARINRMKVVRLVNRLLRCDPTPSINPEWWAGIGKQVGEGKTRAEELYREAVAMGLAMPVSSIRRHAGVTPPTKFRKAVGRSKRPG